MVTDFKAESITRLSGDQCAGLGAPRSPWPLFARFEARKPIGEAPPEVDFIRCAALERHMRAILVIPIQKGHQFSAEFSSSLRNQNPASASVLQGPNCAFNHGNAAVLPNSSVAWLDSLAPTPILEGLAPEDFVLVADQIPRP